MISRTEASTFYVKRITLRPYIQKLGVALGASPYRVIYSILAFVFLASCITGADRVVGGAPVVHASVIGFSDELCLEEDEGDECIEAELDCEDDECDADEFVDGGFRRIGHMNFESPHSNPIAVSPDGTRVYAVNTPDNSVAVIDVQSRTVVDRIRVGIEPVGLAVRPDGAEVWVANHVSDSISVIDSNPESTKYHQVLATLQRVDSSTKSTRFDEPVGIVFSGNEKAYVTLSSTNQVAVYNAVKRHRLRNLDITAQDPRALAVRDGRLYVIPFESNNQTAVSGCNPENLGVDPLCTFDADAHVVNAPGGNAQSLSLNYVLDIVRHPDVPDRDLYIFDTDTDSLLDVVDSIGTLLYGIAVDSGGNVFVAQAEARNDANGKAGTEKHGLLELENRAFLNQITRIDCGGSTCGQPEFFDLEPLPPINPAFEDALATPYAIAVSPNDELIVATAAASDKVFTVDAGSGEVLGQLITGRIPRGIALISNDEGVATHVWVHNTLGNTVSFVDLMDPRLPALVETVVLQDPTDPDLKQGRILFNSASASSTGTFSCASCHPDGHTDQLLWVLDTPLCDVGCDQIQPRLVQDIRGLRGSAPYHWDGIPGDPFGGVNTASIMNVIEPNCDGEIEETCTRHLVDGSMATTMCDLTFCEENDEGKLGPLNAEERDLLAKYLLSVPYPPARERPYTNVMSQQAMRGIEIFQFELQCGNCHHLPYWLNTNMGGSGMDVPSWRGAADRWKNAPQNRFFFADRVRGDTQGFPERFGFTNNPNMFQMILEGSQGVSGSFARQVTLDHKTARFNFTKSVLEALELSSDEDAIVLQGEGVFLEEDGTTIRTTMQYSNGFYVEVSESKPAIVCDPEMEDLDCDLPNPIEAMVPVEDAVEPYAFTRDELFELALNGQLLVTITAYLGDGVGYEFPQPTLAPLEMPVRPMFPGGRPAEFPELIGPDTIRVRGTYIFEDANVVINGRKVEGEIRCAYGDLPDCEADIVLIDLREVPTETGMHLMQVQNPKGLFSNDMPFFVIDELPQADSENLIASGGAFDRRGAWNLNTSGFGEASFAGEVRVDFHEQPPVNQPWRVTLSHDLVIENGQQYTLCYRAKADDYRYFTVNVDQGQDGRFQPLMGNGFTPEVGNPGSETGATLDQEYHQFRHRFTALTTDTTARLRFNLGQSTTSVYIDDVGIYKGFGCGIP